MCGAAAMAFLGHKFRQAHKNQIKRTFSLHAVMDGEESLQFEFDGRFESSAGIACSSERARLQHFYCLKEHSLRLRPTPSSENCKARPMCSGEKFFFAKNSRGVLGAMVISKSR